MVTLLNLELFETISSNTKGEPKSKFYGQTGKRKILNAYSSSSHGSSGNSLHVCASSSPGGQTGRVHSE